MCYTVVHGDHRVVLPMKCSYCISGQLEQAALSTHARPEGELAAMIEKKGQREALRDEVEDGTVANIAREEPLGVKMWRMQIGRSLIWTRSCGNMFES